MNKKKLFALVLVVALMLTGCGKIATLKNGEENHIFKGKGIKKDNQIIYNDGNVQTKVIFDNIITIERNAEYKLKINLKKGINLEGTYITNYGKIELETITSELIQKNNELQITYKIRANGVVVDTFTYNLKFSLDT